MHCSVHLPGAEPPSGYCDATVAAKGRLIHLAGHVAFDATRRIEHRGDLVGQVARTLKNLRETLEAAGASPEHLVKVTIFTKDVAGWRAHQKEIGRAWRTHLGRIWPAMTLVGVVELFEEDSLVEIEGVAVIPS